jgi:hypothetical protein
MSVEIIPMLIGAADYAFVYWLGGGSLFGALIIFLIAKMLGR